MSTLRFNIILSLLLVLPAAAMASPGMRVATAAYESIVSAMAPVPASGPAAGAAQSPTKSQTKTPSGVAAVVPLGVVGADLDALTHPALTTPVIEEENETEEIEVQEELPLDTAYMAEMPQSDAKPAPVSIYALPYSRTLNVPDWKRLWINTSVLGGAFVGTLLVLECLPEDATSWNRAELQDVPLFKRWWDHVGKKGPEWDHDNPIFNYVLHPYAGAAYFMAARSCGFNFYRSLLYSALVSTVGWEFGIEAFMERPSIQDIFITPICGSIIGEGFYLAKRHIVENGYELLGSRFLGGLTCFFIDPVNEVIGLFAGNPARRVAKEHIRFTPGYKSFTLAITF